MQIIAINRSRQSQKIWLKFDDDSLLPLKIDDLVVLGIKKHYDLDTESYLRIQRYSAQFILTEYGLRQVAISPKVAKLLTQKLSLYGHHIVKKYGYPPALISELVTEVVAHIADLGLLDETKFVESYVRRHRRLSSLQLKYQLQSLGINYQGASSDKDTLRQLLIKKVRHVDLTDFNSKNKLIASFCRKGFAADLVKTVIDEYLHIGYNTP